MLRSDPDRKLRLDEQDSIVLDSSLTLPKTIIELPTENYVDSLYVKSRKRRGSSTVFNEQKIEFDKIKLTNLCSVTVNRNPSSDKEVSKKVCC